AARLARAVRLAGCAPSPRSYGAATSFARAERVGVRGCFRRTQCELDSRRGPLTRIASRDAIRPLPASGRAIAFEKERGWRAPCGPSFETPALGGLLRMRSCFAAKR